MRLVWRSTAILAMVLLGAAPTRVLANPEPPAVYDSRAVGMGGTGVAFLEGATGGIYFNPALLDGVKKFDVALTASPLIPRLKAPLSRPGTVTPTESTEAEPAVVPLGLLALGFRVHERITLGVGAYVASGIGVEYKDAGVLDAPATAPSVQDDFDDLKLMIAVFEATVPIAVRITEDLSIGVAWRMGYTTQTNTVLVPNAAGPGLVNRVHQELSGYSPLGGSFGVRYRASRMLSFGFSYRTKMTMELDGKTDIEGNAAPPGAPTKVVAGADTDSKWSTPHQIRLGSSLSLLDEKLLLSLEGRAQFYGDANKRQTSTVDLQGQPLMGATMAPELESSTELHWKNAYAAQLGAEYWVIPLLALRAGATVGNSASNVKYVSPLLPPPGIMYSFTAGLGFKWTHWDAGLAGSFQRASTDAKTSDREPDPGGAPVAPAGQYAGNLYLVAVSVGYRM